MFRLDIMGKFIYIVLVMTFFISSAGCIEKAPEQKTFVGGNSDVFISDRVVEVRIVMKPEIWDNLLSNPKKEEYKQADFWFDGQLVPDVAVRTKGSSSLTYVVDDESIRFSLKVDFNLLNDARIFRDLKKINFHNNYRDPTLMRERLAYELFAQMEVPAPRAAHVDLWVNDTHMGVYTQVEQVDKTFLRKNFSDYSGNLYKPIPPGSYLDWTKEDLEKQRAEMQETNSPSPDAGNISIGGGNLSEIEQVLSTGESEEPVSDSTSGHKFDYIDYMKLKTNEKKSDHSALLRFIDVLNNEPDETFMEEIEKVLDVDEALRFLAVETILVSLDSYLGRGLNYYLYEMDGRFCFIPWDLNETFGTYKCDIPKEDIINFFIDEPTCGPVTERPLVDRLLSQPKYLGTYHEYLEQLLNGSFSERVMNSRIDELSEMIRPFVERDDLKFYTTEEFDENLTEDVGRFFGLKYFVEERGNSVRRQLTGGLPSTGGGEGNGGDWDKA